MTTFADSVRTLSATIAAEMGEVVVGGAHYSVLFFIGVELFLFTFVLNTLAAAFVKRSAPDGGDRVTSRRASRRRGLTALAGAAGARRGDARRDPHRAVIVVAGAPPRLTWEFLSDPPERG